MQVGFGEIIPGTSKKEMGKGEREQDADKGCFNHASCLELLRDSVAHASELSQPWGQVAELFVDIYQPSLWLFVHQITYPSTHSLASR